MPRYRHKQDHILDFMQRVYALDTVAFRKLKFLYHQSGIDSRYSVIPDYSIPMDEWMFYPRSEALDPFPGLEQRMQWYQRHASALSVHAIRDCLGTHHAKRRITHLVTVSCTGMSAPGLDLELMELLGLPANTERSSVNFMGCYAAIHALKMANAICATDKEATVLIVSTELCTLHFQRTPSPDNMASSLLFADGSAAVLVVPDQTPEPGISLTGFYAEVIPGGKKDMAWELSSSGFLMTLSGYIPELIEADFAPLVTRALEQNGLSRDAITHWCIHPGGRRILDAITRCLQLPENSLAVARSILRKYGNMSSPTILFVLREMMHELLQRRNTADNRILGAAFGPGLTMETFVATVSRKQEQP